MLELTPDQLLTTTRAVRKRLDLERPVPREVIEECIGVALQAPSAGNSQPWSFVVVTDPEPKAAIADLYRRSWDSYKSDDPPEDTPDRARLLRMRDSAQFLADRLQDVPAMVIPCVSGRLSELGPEPQAARFGSIIQAGWSFCLAARARGLGTCWTTLHLAYEREVAEILGIPYAEVTQSCLLPVAYTKGTDFKPGPRGDLDAVVHWGRW